MEFTDGLLRLRCTIVFVVAVGVVDAAAVVAAAVVDAAAAVVAAVIVVVVVVVLLLLLAVVVSCQWLDEKTSADAAAWLRPKPRKPNIPDPTAL